MQLEAHCDHRISYHLQISFYKFTLTLFLQVLKFLSFNGINYKSHAKVLCTFKLNSQCHDSVPLMAL